MLPRVRRPITVGLIDDHVLVRSGVRALLDSQPDIRVVGEAGTSVDAVALVERLRPDVVLLDVEIPGSPVTDTVAKVRRISPDTKLLILSMFDGPHLVQSLLKLGISGYLLKSASMDELVSAVRSVRADEGRLVLSVSSRSLAAPAERVTITERERAVLELVDRGLSNTQIANRLSISESAVKSNLHVLFGKLGAVSRLDAVNKAAATSLIGRRRS